MDGIRLENALDIRLGDAGSREYVVLLGGVNVVEGCECRLRPEDEATWMRAWSQLQEADARDVAEVDAWNVTEPACNIFCVVDDERTLPGDVTAVPHLPAASANVSAILAALDITEDANSLDDRHRVLCFGDVVCVNNEGDRRNISNAVSACFDKRRVGRRCKGRCNSISPLVQVDLTAPPPDNRGGMGHVTTTSKIRIGTDASVLTRKARNGTSWTPRMCRALHTGVAADRIGRSQALAELRVDKVDDIGAQRYVEHLGPRKLRDLGSCGAEHLDSRVHPSTIFWPVRADNINLAFGVPKKGPAMRETEFCTHIAHKRECRICGNYNSVYRKYGLFICRRCFKENANKIGFVKLH